MTLDAALFDHLKTAVFFLDKEQNICSFNAAAQQLFNVSLQRSIGKNFSSLFYSAGVYENVAQTVSIASDNHAPFTQYKIRTQLHDATECMFDLSVTPVDGNFLIEIDVADRIARIEAEKKMYSSQASTKNLIRDLAHEIKNPLAGLRGAAQLLDMDIEDKQLKEYVAIILAETNRLAEVVDNLLMPHRNSQFSVINIHEVIERVAKLLQTEIKTKSDAVIIKKSYDPSIPELIADKTQLIQALLNIGSNALRAAQHQAVKNNTQGVVKLRTSIERKFTIDNVCHKLVCRVDIEDNGAGINEDLHETLFFPMISGEQQGTGLGLPIAQSIVHHHQGLITFNSQPGNTCFSIFLPIKIHERN